MPTELGERRRSGRWTPGSKEALSRVRLRTGRELAVINVSTTGALVEGTPRLLPGTHVDVHVTAAQGRVLVRARVVRCAVWTVTADVITYRGALAFNVPVDLLPTEVALQEPSEVATRDPQPVADTFSSAGCPATLRTRALDLSNLCGILYPERPNPVLALEG